MAGRLVVLDRAGRAKSKSFLLPSGMCTLGRGAACDIRVLLPTVSPHHATVTVHANQTVVRNVGSGRTLVNGEPVSVCALRHGDELALGGRRLRWEYDAPAPPRRSKTEPALALPGGAARAARRGTLAAAPRAPDRDVQLALELRHRASMPASSGAGGKQVAIVQPQRRDTTNQNDSSPRAAMAPSATSAPAPAAARKSSSARLHTPTKATLWIESRRGRARAASLRTATPLRLAVLRKALTPAAKPGGRVTKIQAPHRLDRTKRAAIMLMTGHTASSTLSPADRGARRPPSFVAKRRSPAARATHPHSTSLTADTPDESRDSAVKPESVVPETPDRSTRKSNARQSSKRSVSVLEITDSHSPAPASPRKSALKTAAGPRKTESIKFDLSNLDARDSTAAADEDDALAVTDETEDVTLRYSHSPPSPSPRRPIHSRGGRMLESLGSPLRSPLSSPGRRAVASPASPRSTKSARGSAIVRRALETSRPEAYSVVDLVSLDSDASASAYGSLLGCSTPLPAPPSAPRRVSRAGRGRERRDDDATATIDSVVDDASPRSSEKTPARRHSGRLYGSVPSESEDGSPEKSRTSILSTSNLSNLCVPPESPRGDVSFASVGSRRASSRGGRGPRGRVGDTVPDASPDTSRRSRITSTSDREPLGKTLSPTKRGSRSRLYLSIPESPKDVLPDKPGRSRSGTSVRSLPVDLFQSYVSLDSSAISQATARSKKSPKNASPDKSRKSRATSLSTTNRSTRRLPIELSQSDVSLDSSAISRVTARFTKSPKNASPDKSRKSLTTSLSTTNRSTRSLPIELSQSDVSLDSSAISQANARSKKSPKNASPDKSRKSRATSLSTTNRSTRSLPIELSQSDVSLDSSAISQATARSKKSPKNASPDKSRKSRTTSLSTTNRSTRRLPIELSQSDVSLDSSAISQATARSKKSPKNASPDKSRKSRTTSLSTTNRSTRSLPIELSQSDVSLDSSAISQATARSKKSPKNASPDKSRKSRATSLSTTNQSTRSLPIELSQSDVSLDSSAISRVTARSTKSPKSVSPDKSRKSSATLSTSTRRTRSLPYESLGSEVSADKSRKSRATLTASNSSTLPLESSQSDVSLGSSKKSPGKTVSPKRGSRSRLDNGAPESPEADVSPDKSRKSGATLSTSNRRTRSLLSESPRSEVPLDSTRRSKGASKSPKNVSPDKSRKSRATLSSTGRSTRSLVLESSQSDLSLDSSKRSQGKTLSPKRSSRGKVDEGASVASPNRSRKSRASLPTSDRRTRSLSPKRSPEKSAPARGSRSRGSGPASPALDARLSRRSAKSSSASISSTPVASPKNISSNSSRVSRKTLTLDTSARSSRGVGSVAVSSAGDVTPERRAEIEEAATPVLSIRTLLDASLPPAPSPSRSPPRKRGKPAAADKRKTFAGARGATRDARGSIRSRSLIVASRDGDVTPTGASEPAPEAVKHKHSSAKKSRSRRSIIDTLDDSGLVRHLFGSPVKRRLSRSMTEFSRRQLLEEPEEPEPAALETAAAGPDSRGARRQPAPRARRSIRNDLTDVRGVKRAFAREPEDDLRRVSGVRRLFREERPRDDLTDVRGVRELFGRRGPKNELVDVSGVRDGLKARSPNNDLRDVRGVRRLYRRSKAPLSPDMSGVARLLDEPAPAEALFDRLVGRPPVRATYSKTFVARSVKRPGRRRRTTSLSVPVDVLVDRPEDWLRAELQKRVSAANGSVARELQKLATATVAGSTPLTESRVRGASLRRSAAEHYAAHTLPIKKRSLAAAPAPRSARKRSLPLKKRALVHSTPVKGRARAADDTLARMSPIVAEPAPLREPALESPPVVPVSPKEKPKTGKTKTEDAVAKNESVGPSPKKTRAERAEEAAEFRRATRGGKAASNVKTRTPKKTAAAERAATEKAPTPKRSPAPRRAPATRRAPASPAKAPAPRRAAAAAARPTVVAKKSRAVAKPTIDNVDKSSASDAAPPSPAPATSSRSKKPAPSPVAVAPAAGKRGRTRARPAPASPPARKPVRGRAARASLVIPKPSPRLKPRAAPRVARPPAGDRSAPDSPETAPAPGGKRARRVDAAGDAPQPAATRRARAAPSPAPRRKTRKAPPTPSERRGRKAPLTPESKKRRMALPTPEPKKARKAPPSPDPRRGGREAPPAPEPKRGRGAPPSAELKQTSIPKRGRRAPPTPVPEKGSEAPPTPKPKRGRGAPPIPEPKRGRKTPTPEPKRGRKAPPTPEPKVAKATPEPKRGRNAGREPKNALKTAPTPKPKRGRGAVPPTPEPPRGRKAPTVVSKKVHRTPEPKKSLKAPPAPEPKRGRGARAAPPEKRGPDAEPEQPKAKRGRAAARQVEESKPAARAVKSKNAAPKEAPKPKGKKVATPVVEESATRGRKRKNDTASVEKKSEPSPKKPRAARAAAPAAAAPTRGRRR